jgi:hypothetical protein
MEEFHEKKRYLLQYKVSKKGAQSVPAGSVGEGALWPLKVNKT